jgi:hypothetical protein
VTSADVLAVACEPAGEGFVCHVTVGDDPGATHHEVRVARPDLLRLAPGATDPDALVTASFRYLLEREPRGSILRAFDLPVIERYFPSYATDVLALLP